MHPHPCGNIERLTSYKSGDNGGGDTRVPIPNTTVKPSSADGTWTAGSWESRTLPGNTEVRCQKPEVRLERICLKCKFEQESDY